MDTIHLRTHDVETVFEQLQQHFGGDLQKKPDEYVLKLNSDLVRGTIHGIYLNSFTFLEYDVIFAQDIRIVSHSPSTNPIYFLYCAKGKLNHLFVPKERIRILKQFQAGIFSSTRILDSALLFEKEQPVKATVITVSTTGEAIANGDLDFLRYKLINTFMPKGKATTFFYKGSANLKIAHQVQRLDELEQDGIVRYLLVKSIVNNIFALELQQYERDVKKQLTQSGSLTIKEMDEIKELSDFIRNYPDRKFRLANFVRKTGLSPAKLQEGFKLLHGETVGNYIRTIRLEYAEELIKTTNLNISEVVYATGLSSRSYFSKIFKEKYDCLPKQFRENQQSTETSIS